MRAFVTGATGFLGRRVVARLVERGDEVTALVRPETDAGALEAAGVEVVRGDLADVETVLPEAARADVIFHVGALVASSSGWDDFQRANVEGTRKLLSLAADGSVERFVHVSSLGIFEIDRDGITISEDAEYDHFPMQRGNYTRSKIQADRLARTAAREGAPVIVVRPSVLYGPTDGEPTLFLGRVKKWLKPDLLAVVSSPSYIAPLCYVENAADAVVLAGIGEGLEGRVFNVVDDPGLSQHDYFAALGRARRNPFKVWYLPVVFFAPALLAVDKLHRLLRGRPWHIAHQLLRSGRTAYYKTDAARDVLGWEPRIGLDEALTESLGR